MKSLAVFLILIGFSMAIYTPQWNVSNPFNNAFKPTKVEALMKPVLLLLDYVRVCGDVQTDFTVANFSYEIVQLDRVALSGTKELTQEDLKAGDHYCFTDKFLVSIDLVGGNFTLKVTLKSPDEQICAIDIDLPEPDMPVERI